MYKDLLKYIIEHKIYVEIRGLTQAGSEKILTTGEDGIYRQKNVVFSAEMVKSLLFHEKGCTITLKS